MNWRFFSWLIFILIVIGATIYSSFKFGYNKGFKEGEEWTVQTILDYNPTPITCDGDCDVS